MMYCLGSEHGVRGAPTRRLQPPKRVQDVNLAHADNGQLNGHAIYMVTGTGALLRPHQYRGIARHCL